MTRISTNVPSLRGLRNLQKTNQALTTSLQRLSTGLQINSGKDNPAGLIAGEKLRSQVTAIEQSIKNSNRANNVIATADGALGEVHSLLNQIRGLVQEGLNEGALSQSEIDANQLQIDNALSAINRISANTTFAGDKLIDGSKAFTTQVAAADAGDLDDIQVNEALFGTNSTIEVDATVSTAGQKGELRYIAGGLTATTTLELSGAKGSQVLFFSADSTVDNVLDAANAVQDITGVQAAVSTAAVAGTSTYNSAGVNSDVVFTDARTTSGTGVFDDKVRIEFIDPSAGSAALGLAFTNHSNGDTTITVNLATFANGNISSTSNDVAALINGNATANALVSAADEGAGAGVVDALATAALADGTDGRLAFTSTNFGSNEFVDINVLNGAFATLESDETTASARDAGTDIAVVIEGQVAQTSGLRASIKTATLDVSLDFDATAGNVAGNALTVTITGGGSLFQIGQEVSAGGQLGVGIEAVNTARLGGVSGKIYELSSGGGKSLLDVGPSVQGSTLVDIVDQARDRVSTMRGRLGAIQKNVIETNISTLGVILENVAEARSQIVDTDFASETASLTRAQILNQAGISVLSIANQNPGQVLSLLG